MTVPLFAPDLFSRPRPVFHPAGDEAYQKAVQVLSSAYGFDESAIDSVSALEGLEVNSKNFKIAIGGKFYALKCGGEQLQADTCRLQLEVTQVLFEQDAALPNIINTQGGEVFSIQRDRKIWILSDFVEGTYFTGAADQVVPTFKAIAKLQNDLEGMERTQNLPISAAANSWDSTHKILEDLFSRQAEWGSLFPETEADALSAYSDILHESITSIAAVKGDKTVELTPTHIDLHPHNILIDDDGAPVIIDIDSLQLSDKMQSLGFAMFKLLRQYVVHEEPDQPHGMTQACLNALGYRDGDMDMLMSAARAEVLRRIGIIADLNMNKANRDWNKVLHLQLAALKEAAFIFDLEKDHTLS